MNNICSHCKTSYEDIFESGFVGCEHCYQEIDNLRLALNSMYQGKKHIGRGARRKNAQL